MQNSSTSKFSDSGFSSNSPKQSQAVKNVASYLACCSYLPFGNHTVISLWWVFSIKPDDQTDETESPNLVNKTELKSKVSSI